MRLDDIVHRPLALRPPIGNALHESLAGGEFMQSMTIPLHIAQCAFDQVISIDSIVCSSYLKTVCPGVCLLSAIGRLRYGLISFSILMASCARQSILPFGREAL